MIQQAASLQILFYESVELRQDYQLVVNIAKLK